MSVSTIITLGIILWIVLSIVIGIGGKRREIGGIRAFFISLVLSASFWSATVDSSSNAFLFNLNYRRASSILTEGYSNFNDRQVRCVKNPN